MSAWIWITTILTSPFWFVLGIIVCYFLFLLIFTIFAIIGELIEQFLKLFKRRI